MKKLNILQPEVRVAYLNGSNQGMDYLRPFRDLEPDALRKDVGNGAAQFKELMEIIDSQKKPPKCVIINCNSVEEGLMAVDYLAVFFNREDEARECFDSWEDWEGDCESDDECGEYMFDTEDDGIDSCFTDGEGRWQEDPWKIPVVKYESLSMMFPMVNFAPQNSFMYGGAASGQNNMPGWYYALKESICFVARESDRITVDKLKRYRENKHVFIIRVKDEDAGMIHECWREHDQEDVLEQLSEVAFEFAAEIVNIGADEETMKNYRANLFENFVEEKGYALAEKFPIDNVVEKITGKKRQNEPSFIGKAIDYVTRNIPKGAELEEKHFKILNKLKMFAKMDEEKKEGKAMSRLENELIGMEDVKRQIKKIIRTMKFHRRRRERGMKNSFYHNVFMMVGAPGTAKTTIAEILGEIMAEEGLLKGGKFIAINGAELKGQYVGHSAPKVTKIFEENDVIFIDEAYSIAAGANGEYDSFSQEAVAQLVSELEKHGEDRLVLFAGYGGTDVSEKDNWMKDFLDINPGIKSRINATISFDSYSADEMVDIFMHRAKMEQYTIGEDADAVAREYFEERRNAPDFGNGREARSLFENAVAEVAQRVADVPEEEITDQMLSEILAADVKNAVEQLKLGDAAQRGAVTHKTKLGFVG